MRAAEEAVRHYFAEFNSDIDAGNFDQVRSLYAPSCSLCAQDTANYERIALEGHRVEGTHFVVSSVKALQPNDVPLVVVAATLHSEAGKELDRQGVVLGSYPETPPIELLISVSTDDHKIADVEKVPT